MNLTIVLKFVYGPPMDHRLRTTELDWRSEKTAQNN